MGSTPHGSSRQILGTCSAPQANERRRGRAVASAPASGYGQVPRYRDAGVHQADDTCPRDEASGRAALSPRSRWTRSGRLVARDRRPRRSCIREKQQRRTDGSYPCSSIVRRHRAPVASRRLLVVHLSSQRTLVPVRQDVCFAEKQEPHPGLLLHRSPRRERVGRRSRRSHLGAPSESTATGIKVPLIHDRALPAVPRHGARSRDIGTDRRHDPGPGRLVGIRETCERAPHEQI
jgi:hypothetical protein